MTALQVLQAGGSLASRGSLTLETEACSLSQQQQQFCAKIISLSQSSAVPTQFSDLDSRVVCVLEHVAPRAYQGAIPIAWTVQSG